MPGPTPSVDPQLEARRQRVRRTVLLFAVIAVLVYVGFILTGVLGHAVASHGAPQ